MLTTPVPALEPPLIVYPTPVAGLSHLCAAFRVLIP
jgi:hypothetical protein